MQAWEDLRRNGHRDTTLALVAGVAGSGKTEFSAFLSSVTIRPRTPAWPGRQNCRMTGRPACGRPGCGGAR